MEWLDALSADKWRALIRDFDAKRVQFVNELKALQVAKGANPTLEKERAALLTKAGTLQKQIDGLYNVLKTARDWLARLGGFFGAGQGGQMGSLGLAPVAIGVSLAAAAVIVASITDWLKNAAAFNAKNRQALLLLKAGATPEEINKALQGQPGTASSKIFGFDVRWILAIGAVFMVAPLVIKRLK